MEELQLCHELFIIDADLIQALDESKKEVLTRGLVDDLLKTLEMKELAPLGIYEAIDKKAPGWSFIQPITTSHISGHYFAAPGPKPHIHIDIYSCKKFAWESIPGILHKHFPIEKWFANAIIRKWRNESGIIKNISGVGSDIYS